ncbi:MAG: fumarylacetoacetate hydrolase family protein [Acidobacteria bacterium]|nr:fumarylacetoacetate hydrolase family protein [Acidobacteriota bacterium]
MKFLTFSTAADARPRLGALRGDRVVELPGTLLDLIAAGPSRWRTVAGEIAGGRIDAPAHEVAGIRWHAPIPRPAKNVFCVGRNYAGHVAEATRARGAEVKLPTIPLFFTKTPTTVTGPCDDILWDRAATQKVDWEAELGVIIGVSGRNIPRAAALQHVFGYTVINDVTARDLQDAHGQFFKGKSLDGFCPMGPSVVTPDEFGDPHAKAVTLRVNGVVKQQGHTRDMIFPIDILIESLSRGMTLEAGDILATGTPDGVGFARTPPEFLADGDVMETEVEGIGVLRNRIVAR